MWTKGELTGSKLWIQIVVAPYDGAGVGCGAQGGEVAQRGVQPGRDARQHLVTMAQRLAPLLPQLVLLLVELLTDSCQRPVSCVVTSSMFGQLCGHVVNVQSAVWSRRQCSVSCVVMLSMFSQLCGHVVNVQSAVWSRRQCSVSCVVTSSMFSQLCGHVVNVQSAVR